MHCEWRWIAIALLLAWPRLPSPGDAQVIEWNGATGNWYDTTWLPAGNLPTTATDIWINNGGTVRVPNEDSEGRDIYLGLAIFQTGHLEVLGAPASLAASNVFVGVSGAGTLNIFGGGVISNNATQIGSQANSTGELMVTDSGSRLTSAAGINVGDEGSGLLGVTAGGNVSTLAVSIGRIAGAEGLVIVDGAESRIESSGNFVVGTRSTGRLDISAGGAVSSGKSFIGSLAGATGTATVDGVGSSWSSETGDLVVGDAGTGTLNISRGGAVTNAAALIGGENTGNGSVLVSGSGSTWTVAGRLVVGELGSGSLRIAEGGSVSSGDAVLGEFVGGVADPADGKVRVGGMGSTWTVQGKVTVGYVGEGELRITNGGTVSSVGGDIGSLNAGEGLAIIDGAGSSWLNAGELNVGRGAVGRLQISAGAASTAVDAFIGRHPGAWGEVIVDGNGSSWSIDGRLSIGGDANTDAAGGVGRLVINPESRVTVADDIVVFPGGAVLLQGGTLDAQEINLRNRQFQWTAGTLHAVRFQGDLLNQGGTLAPGQSAGDILIQGDYTQQRRGMLEIEIGGIGMGSQYDVVTVTGSALVDGQLNLTLIDGFVPAPTDTFDVFSANSLLGVFDNAGNNHRVATVDGGGSFLVHYGVGSTFDPKHIVLSDFQTTFLPGDYNNDGVVGAADYVKWRNNPSAFGNAQGYTVWVNNFGRTSGSGTTLPSNTAAAGVPEPASAVLLLIAAVVTLWRCSLRRPPNELNRPPLALNQDASVSASSPPC